MKIGIDLDNTIICYDEAFVAGALERGLISADFTGSKQDVRDHIRTLPDGETKWQALQGYIYGKGISHASLYDGVTDFIQGALEAGHIIHIISHKTEFGHYDPDKINLRHAALGFLEKHEFFSTVGLDKSTISFHSTRVKKVHQIAEFSPTWFIDDLMEVYEEPHFPASTKKILFSNSPAHDSSILHCSTWQDISELVLA